MDIIAENNYSYSSPNEPNRTAHADAITGKPLNARNLSQQRKAGGELATDDGSHLIAHINGGTNSPENFIAMDKGLNRGPYKSMELSVKSAVKNNPQSKVSMTVNTSGSAKRPDTIQVTTQMTDKQGKVQDVSHTSYTNLNKKTMEKLNTESGTDFPGYQETLTPEQRELANKASEELIGKKINDGLDKGWSYTKKGEKTMGNFQDRRAEFIKQIKVPAEKMETQKKTVTTTSEEEGKGSLERSLTTESKTTNTKGTESKGLSLSSVSSVGKTGNTISGKGSSVSAIGSVGKGASTGGHGASIGSKGASTGGHGSSGGIGGHGGSGGHGGHGGHGGR